MTEAETMERADTTRGRQEGDAWTVADLAARWRTSERQIYDLIDIDQLHAFSISRTAAKRKRGLRVTDEERLRFERSGHPILKGDD